MLKKSYVSGNKIFTFIIISSIFSIILNELLPEIYLLGFFLVLVLFFGIIHGANDIYLIINNSKNRKSISKMTIFYVIIVLIITLCFFSSPSISLIFFILFSCYHFGEQQWTILDDNNSNDGSLLGTDETGKNITAAQPSIVPCPCGYELQWSIQRPDEYLQKLIQTNHKRQSDACGKYLPCHHYHHRKNKT